MKEKINYKIKRMLLFDIGHFFPSPSIRFYFLCGACVWNGILIFGLAFHIMWKINDFVNAALKLSVDTEESFGPLFHIFFYIAVEKKFDSIKWKSPSTTGLGRWLNETVFTTFQKKTHTHTQHTRRNWCLFFEFRIGFEILL